MPLRPSGRGRWPANPPRPSAPAWMLSWSRGPWRCTAWEAGLPRRLPMETRTFSQWSASLESGAAAAERSSSSGGWGARQPKPRPRPAHAQRTPSPRLAHASPAPRAPPVPACDQGRPTDRSVLRGRFDASHDSWELEDNVSEGLAAAFRKGRRTQPSEHTPANLLASNAAASRKELREQYGAGDLGPAPKRRQRDGESSHEAEEERRPPSGAPFEPKTLLPDDVKAVLTQWCLDNIDSPYPNEREKHEICAVTHLTFTQVNNWCVACDARICALSRSAPCLHAVSNAYAPLPLGVTSLCRRHPHTRAHLTACCPRTGLPTGASASGRRSRPTIERRRASSVGRVAQAMLMGRRPSLRRRRRAARATAEH